ncbi:DEAD/DEAH box helicase [Novosphingobium kaempferiae]|uniref:DEAD/DEAH box helicase n=1 Tax=Novosphingobium kaempferiae TaxID=2896849 RepID=UPI001E479158|nr:DEAD/DEAH box helicase [Novosphingobium kaempferiae]
MSYFSELGLAEPILRALAAKGYTDPSPIQRKAIPSLLEGRDLLGIAQTGTGKTAAFSLPSLHRLANDPKPRQNAGCRMLVLSPTRELAAQIAENMRGYAKFLNLTVQCIFGGVPVGKQARALERGTDILVATPGRLLDLIDQRALTLKHVEIFVLDEADQMMDLGFIVPLKRVAALLPKTRQSLFFSATMPQAIAELGRQFINDPVKVEVAPQSTTAERVEQYATHINQAEKQALLTISLREGLAPDAAENASHGAIDRALVFTRTKHGADRVVRHLVAAGIPAAAIHGNKSQAQRTAALGGFRQGTVRILVATDIAARGIDVSGVSHVYNFEIPNVAEQYVHRIGRTARAGADGVAISYVAPDEKPYIRDIERLTRVKLEALPLPENFMQLAARLPAPSRKVEQPQGERRQGGGRSGGGRGGEGRGEGRGGQPRREGQRDGQRSDRPQGERSRSEAPRGDRREGAEGGERKRRFRPRGPKGMGAHKGAVKRAG